MLSVLIVDDFHLAKVLVDPMRRTILGLLRKTAMTQTQLADALGLSNASLNYHMKILRGHGLVSITRSVAEGHGIMQKFFSASAYLLVYDVDSIPKDLSRYFYPIALERARTFVSLLMVERRSATVDELLEGQDIDSISASLSSLLVSVARQYVGKKVSYGDEKIVYEIYTKAFNLLLKRAEAQSRAIRKRAR